MHEAERLTAPLMALMLVALWAPTVWSQSPTATHIRPSDPNEITVELPKLGPPVADTRDGGEPVAVIPGGQEELLAEMVGRGVKLAGGCSLSSGQIDGPTMLATYACPGGSVVVELVHPDQGAAGSTKTERFAMAVKSGAAPDGFLADLAERVRAREATFEWKWLGTPRAQSSSHSVFVMAAVGVAIIAALALVLRVRRSR